MTVASDPTEGYRRYLRSAAEYGINVKTLGLDEPWKGGDMATPGGGYKVNLLRRALEPYKDTDTVVLFTDSYDVLFLGRMKEILKRFLKFDAGIVFGAEHYCWPDTSLREKYPLVLGRGARFLNSGLFMGYAKELFELLAQPIGDTDDDQLYYTNRFLDEATRERLRIKLDNRAEIFQNLHGAEKEVKLEFSEAATGEAYLRNVDFETSPLVVHGNGPSKVMLNGFANYLANAFVHGECKVCDKKPLLDDFKLPRITLAVFVEKPMPFFEEFLDRLLAINYLKQRIDLFVHINAKHHEMLIDAYVTKFGEQYGSVKRVVVEDSVNEAVARDLAVKWAIENTADYLFVVDAEVHIDNPDVLRDLLRYDR